MRKKAGKVSKSYADTEKGTIRKSDGGLIQVALVYPNTYQAGMSNLGFQTVYQRLNAMQHVACERFFLPDRGESNLEIRSVESGRKLSDADFIAFSVSFENDYLNLIQIIEKASLPLRSNARKDSYPFLIAGGVACFLNPEPLAPFIDCFLLGEAEELLVPFFEAFNPDISKDENLKIWATTVEGCYVPDFYTPSYDESGMLKAFTPDSEIPSKVKSMTAMDISKISTCSTIVTPESSFKNTYLIEISRGCSHGCRFCSAGFIYRPPRFRPPELIEENILEGSRLCDHIGLVGAAVSDYPELTRVVNSEKSADVSRSPGPRLRALSSLDGGAPPEAAQRVFRPGRHDVHIGQTRRRDAPPHRPGQHHVVVGLSSSRQHMAGIAEGDRVADGGRAGR